MKIIIEADPNIDNPEEVMFNQFKEWCDLAFNSNYKLEIEGTKYKFEKK